MTTTNILGFLTDPQTVGTTTTLGGLVVATIVWRIVKMALKLALFALITCGIVMLFIPAASFHGSANITTDSSTQSPAQHKTAGASGK